MKPLDLKNVIFSSDRSDANNTMTTADKDVFDDKISTANIDVSAPELLDDR